MLPCSPVVLAEVDCGQEDEQPETQIESRGVDNPAVDILTGAVGAKPMPGARRDELLLQVDALRIVGGQGRGEDRDQHQPHDDRQPKQRQTVAQQGVETSPPDRR